MMTPEAGEPRGIRAEEAALRTTLDKTERILNHAATARAMGASLGKAQPRRCPSDNSCERVSQRV